MLFAIQREASTSQPLDVVRIAIPLLIYVAASGAKSPLTIAAVVGWA